MYTKEIEIAEKLLKSQNPEGIKLLINLIVRINQDPNHIPSEQAKTAILFGELLSKKTDRKTLLEILEGIHPSSIQFLANLAAEFGHLKNAVSFTEEACSLETMPLHLINFYLDLMDSAMLREKAITIAFQYLKLHPEFSLKQSSQTEEDLQFLNLYFKIIKLCYCQKKLDQAASICQMLEPIVAAYKNLHQTSIKNGYSYSQYIKELIPLKNLSQDYDERLYIIGDSHCLSPAWDVVEFNQKQCLIEPVLITGCKLWHLRDEGFLHAKVNYQEALHLISEGSTLIYVFGEIDCREGILPSVEKKLYPSVEAAMDLLINIYMAKVQEAILMKKLAHVYIHQVPPVIDVTRPTVMVFNKLLKQRVLKLKEEGIKVSWLGFKDDLLTSSGQINPLFTIDDVHLHPRYFQTRQVD